MSEFVEDWSLLHTLGEGAFGEYVNMKNLCIRVKLLVHRLTGDTVAVKIIDYEKHKDAAPSVKKEICIHKLLVHPNIIRYYGQRKDTLREYIFLEYASGGELFNKIEPDVGMSNAEAQKFFKQLLHGITYLHEKGIAHRDIKPENLLLDHNDNLKITDFGMATIFRLRGTERLLDKKCGTLPYIPPEVLERPYRAQPADLWSCGIVLVALLSGELPWDQPTLDYVEYEKWKNGKYMLISPWKKLDNLALSLVRCILVSDPEHRYTLSKIMNHTWMKQVFEEIVPTTDVVDGIETQSQAKKLCSANDASTAQQNKNPIEKLLAMSQPVLRKESPSTGQLVNILQERDQISFSQPTHFDDLILGSQLQFTQSPLNQSNFTKLICRMTRFFVTTDWEKTLETLCSKLDKYTYTWTTDSSGLLTISTVDSRKTQLIFKANVINMNGKLLLDFRLSKGCGLEFKRRFLKLKHSLKDIVFQDVC